MNAEFQVTLLSQPMKPESAEYQSLLIWLYFIYIFHRADKVEQAHQSPKIYSSVRQLPRLQCYRYQPSKSFGAGLLGKSQNVLIKTKQTNKKNPCRDMPRSYKGKCAEYSKRYCGLYFWKCFNGIHWWSRNTWKENCIALNFRENGACC